MNDDIFAQMRQHVVAALAELVPGLPMTATEKVEVTPTRDASHGDMASNAALVAAKPARMAPAKLAQALAERLLAAGHVAKAEAAGPGFLNLTLSTDVLRAQLPVILRAGIAYGDNQVGQGVRANVEYVSANPTGPMHIGHCRGAVVGDALATLLAKSGYDVTREYYINDAGAQVIALAWATYFRYLQALGCPMSADEFSPLVPGGLQYRGEYLVPVGEALARMHGAVWTTPDFAIVDPAVWLDTVRDFAVSEMMQSVREDLALLGVEQAVFSSERALVADGAADATIAHLDAAGLIYEGVLEPPKGKLPDDWEPREQTLFRATRYGDDVDRPLRKSDGSNTYFANDIAYHADKIARGAEVLIDIWGADHGGYVSRMKSAVQALTPNGSVKLEVVLCQIVKVIKDGVLVRMSKRAGSYVTLRDLIEEVGRDVVRFTMLTRKNDAQMDFDLNHVVAQTRDNPVYYVQYAHARCRSVLRKGIETFGAPAVTEDALAAVDLSSLDDAAEFAVMRRLAAWPRTVQGAALAREPHRIAFFLYDLAGDFHMLWHRGSEDAALRFVQADQPARTLARLALVSATSVVIRSGLAVMGVNPVEELR